MTSAVAGGPAVLLVDDRRENLLALEAVLAPLEVRLVSALSGEEALRALLSDEFAVMLLDVQMPGMDGFETARLVRGRERTKHLPIIFVTALSRDLEHVARGYESGAVDYVLKPFDPFVLRSKVQIFCDLERHRRDRERADETLRRAWTSSPTGVAVIGADGRVLRTNPALDALAGDAASRGQPLVGDLVAPADRPRLETVLTRLRGGDDEPTRLELALGGDGGADESAIPVAVSAVALGDGEVLLQFDDLRQRQRAQRAQAQLVSEQTARVQAEALAARLAKVAAVTEGLDHLSLDRLIPTLVERVVDVLGVAGASAIVAPDETGAEPLTADHGEPVPEELLRSAAEEDRPASGATGALAVPLRVEGRTVGVLGVSGAGSARGAGPELPGLLRHAADRGALIVERARLFERERRIAATLQEDLLPDVLPKVPGIALSTHFRSGGAGTQVGGDWYDALALPGGRLGILVGDVAGRGVAAAARMGELRAAARAYVLEGHLPAELATRLNAYHLALGGETMTTLLYAVIEPDRARLRYVSAGHVPPLLTTPGRPARYLDEHGPPLGVLDIVQYEEAVADFEPGSMLGIYTDGLVERRNETLDHGLERLRAAVAGATDDPEAAKLAALEACLEGDVDDDVTAVFARAQARLGSPAHFVLTPQPDALVALRGALRRWLGEVGASEEEAGEITLAVNEAWQNALEHGHAFAAAPISIDLDTEDGEVVVRVRDLGHDGDRTADPDRGRGIALMRELMDHADVDVDGPGGGTVTLRRRLRGAR